MTTTPRYTLQDMAISGEQLSPIIERLEETLDGVPNSVAIVSLLTLAIFIQKPDLPMEELSDIAFDVSKYVCVRLTGIDQPTGKMN